jgi:putative hemolysin
MELLIPVALVLLNGVLALSKTAVVSARKSRRRQQADEGRSGAAAALALAAERSRFLSTVQVGIMLVGLLSGAIGAAQQRASALVEALVGDVATVDDGAGPDIVQQDNGSWLVDGDVAPERFRGAGAPGCAAAAGGNRQLPHPRRAGDDAAQPDSPGGR